MGDFRIVIDAVGGHGQDREKKNGEVVNFSAHGENAPEALAQKFLTELQATGVSVNGAKVIHWPKDNYPEDRKDQEEIVDDLLTGVRSGSF